MWLGALVGIALEWIWYRPPKGWVTAVYITLGWVAVIGIPDDKWGELVTALVVTTPGSALSEADVIAWTRQKLAGYKCPKKVEFRTELARTATGKLQKFKLREPFWADSDRKVN